MTVLAQKLCDVGWYNNVALADAAITDGDVYRDDNNQIRAIGRTGIVCNVAEANAATVAALTLKHDRPMKGKY